MNILLIARRDLRSYFISPIAYVLMAGFSCIFGYMFFSIFNYYVA